MRIRSVSANNHRKAFEVRFASRLLSLPYAEVKPTPVTGDLVVDCCIDRDLGREAFSYRLASGAEGVVHSEQVLEYNQDPGYLRDLLLYDLTLQAQRRVAAAPLSKREIIRRLGTSASQFYRLLDQTNYRKSVDQMLKLLHVLGCEVELRVRPRTA